MFLTDEHIGRELMESFKHHDFLGSFDRNTHFHNNTSRHLDRMKANNHESEDHLLMGVMDLEERYEGLIKFLGVVEGPLEEVQEDTQDGDADEKGLKEGSKEEPKKEESLDDVLDRLAAEGIVFCGPVTDYCGDLDHLMD